MNSILVVFDYNSNTIICEPMKNITGPTIVTDYKMILTLPKTRGLKKSLQRLENEASTMLRKFMTSDSINFRLAPTNIHRRNADERAIQTFKNHFIAVLCSTNSKSPMQLWDGILNQVQIPLNLLRA